MCSLVFVIEDSKNNIINKFCFESILEDKVVINNLNDIEYCHLKAS